MEKEGTLNDLFDGLESRQNNTLCRNWFYRNKTQTQKGEKMNSAIWFILLMTTILLLGVFGFTYYHELAHQKINAYFGAKSHIEMALDGGHTIYDSNFPSHENMELAQSAHSFNESLGYQLMPLTVIIFFSIMLTALYIKSKI